MRTAPPPSPIISDISGMMISLHHQGPAVVMACKSDNGTGRLDSRKRSSPRSFSTHPPDPLRPSIRIGQAREDSGTHG